MDTEYPLGIRRLTGGDVPFDFARAEAFPLKPIRVRGIDRKFGVRYHISNVHRVVRSLGFTPQKPERLARERDDLSQEDLAAIKKR